MKTEQDVITQRAKFAHDGWAAIHRSIAAGRRNLMGDVFTDDQKRWHGDHRKPALTYNVALAHFKQHAGATRQAKIQERVYPLGDGSVETAAALTRIVNSQANRGYLQHIHQFVADDTWVGGLGVSEIYFDTLVPDPFGTVRAVRGNPIQHMFDLSALSPDGGDIMDAMKTSWLDRRGLARMFPKIEVEDPAFLDAIASEGISNLAGDGTFDFKSILGTPGETEHHDFSIEDVSGIRQDGAAPVCEWLYRKIENRIYIYDFITQRRFDVSEMDDARVAEILRALQQSGGVAVVVRKPSLRLYLTVLAGTRIVVDERPFEPNVLPWTYSLGYRLGGTLLGEGVSLIDPSRGFSKTMSAMTEQISKASNKGLITIGTLDDEADEGTLQQLEEIAAGRGGHAHMPAGSDVKIVDYNTNTTGFQNYGSQMLEVMKIVASSPDNQRGIGEGSHQSGIHAQTMIAQAMIGGEYLRENLLLARKVFTRTLIKFIQHYDGAVPYRIFNILDDEGAPEDVMFNIELADRVVNDLGTGDYDVTVDFQTYTVTDRRARAAEVIAAAQNSGTPLPLRSILRLSEVPESDKLAKEIQDDQMQQQQQMLLAAIAGEKQTA